eukprot:TRINITY_DN1785_c0_g3_i2.p1 TRINITY_DN1785_c0_g3~~TRINITY_DN1785_c0_g3_i2.p1  ORF type:complete len:298 (+),score=57.33 TRINITY_DN1785_c0_g3_i2:114-896(+)
MDTHVHIHRIFDFLRLPHTAWPSFSQQKVIPISKRINRQSNYLGCVNVCCAPKYFAVAEKLMEYDGVYATFGIHPQYASFMDDSIQAKIESLMSHPKCVALGECGLDYVRHLDKCDTKIQKAVFIKQIQLAIKHEKPIVIHSREADEDLLAILGEYIPKNWKIHLHCWTGKNWKIAQHLLNEFPNLFFGFTGVITFPNCNYLREIVRQIPLNRILLETDGPYMAPEGFRQDKVWWLWLLFRHWLCLWLWLMIVVVMLLGE